MIDKRLEEFDRIVSEFPEKEERPEIEEIEEIEEETDNEVNNDPGEDDFEDIPSEGDDLED